MGAGAYFDNFGGGSIITDATPTAAPTVEATGTPEPNSPTETIEPLPTVTVTPTPQENPWPFPTLPPFPPFPPFPTGTDSNDPSVSLIPYGNPIPASFIAGANFSNWFTAVTVQLKNWGGKLLALLPLSWSERQTAQTAVPAGQIWTFYYYAGSQRVAMRVMGHHDESKNGVTYLLSDHLGSTSVTYHVETGTVTRIGYKPWGQTRYTTGEISTPYQYTGQRHMAGIGLYYYHARWYDPTLGHFIQANTIVPQQGNPQPDRCSFIWAIPTPPIPRNQSLYFH